MATLRDRDQDSPQDSPPDFDRLWDYNQPEDSETRFRSLLDAARASGDADYLAHSKRRLPCASRGNRSRRSGSPGGVWPGRSALWVGLSRDPGLKEMEPERLARLLELGGGLAPDSRPHRRDF
jgi:hypothetical protein